MGILSKLFKKTNQTQLINSKITVQELSIKMGCQASEIIMKLMKMGTMATINQEIDFDMAALICNDFGFTLMKSDTSEMEELEIEALMDIEVDSTQNGTDVFIV